MTVAEMVARIEALEAQIRQLELERSRDTERIFNAG